jgi:hypothetical protein
MLALVETPKWSFMKLEYTKEGYKRILTSPDTNSLQLRLHKGIAK